MNASWNNDRTIGPSVAEGYQKLSPSMEKAKDEAPQPGIEPETFRLLGPYSHNSRTRYQLRHRGC
jgi:hypothetical protein